MSALNAGFFAPIRRSSDGLGRTRSPLRKNTSLKARKKPSTKVFRTISSIEEWIPDPESTSSAHAGEACPSIRLSANSPFPRSSVNRLDRQEFRKTTTAMNFTSRAIAKDL